MSVMFVRWRRRWSDAVLCDVGSWSDIGRWTATSRSACSLEVRAATSVWWDVVISRGQTVHRDVDAFSLMSMSPPPIVRQSRPNQASLRNTRFQKIHSPVTYSYNFNISDPTKSLKCEVGNLGTTCDLRAPGA